MATTVLGDTLYKLVEGYTPAQSMYVLRNDEEPQLDYWHAWPKVLSAPPVIHFKRIS